MKLIVQRPSSILCEGIHMHDTMCSCAPNGLSDGNVQLKGAELNIADLSLFADSDLHDEIPFYYFTREATRK